MGKFNKGDFVVVVRQCRYRNIPIGAVGIVYNANPMYENNIAVKLDSFNNNRSSYGCFYFKADEIELYKGETKIMEGNYKIATVRFMDEKNDKTYKYALYDDSINVGDTCVVKSAHHGFGIAFILNIEDKTEEKITREVVCKCDFSAYEEREAKRKRKEELKRKMNARAAALQEIALFKLMSENDKDMASMLHEFEGLGDC